MREFIFAGIAFIILICTIAYFKVTPLEKEYENDDDDNGEMNEFERGLPGLRGDDFDE